MFKKTESFRGKVNLFVTNSIPNHCLKNDSKQYLVQNLSKFNSKDYTSLLLLRLLSTGYCWKVAKIYPRIGDQFAQIQFILILTSGEKTRGIEGLHHKYHY